MHRKLDILAEKGYVILRDRPGNPIAPAECESLLYLDWKHGGATHLSPRPAPRGEAAGYRHRAALPRCLAPGSAAALRADHLLGERRRARSLDQPRAGTGTPPGRRAEAGRSTAVARPAPVPGP